MAVPKLTFVPYLQTWNPLARELSIRVLIAPTGNPLEPLVVGRPSFATSSFGLQIAISDTAATLPIRTLVDQTVTTPAASAPDAVAIFLAMKAGLKIPDGAASDTFSEQGRDLSRQLRKYLPRSYRGAFDFVAPRTSLGVLDDSYKCLMRCPPEPAPDPPPMVIGWGEAIAFALRRPRLAEALGLIRSAVLPLDAAPRLENGGWIWVEAAPGGDYDSELATPGFQRAFATRVPPLDGADRPVFTPVVFPVSDTAADIPPGNFDKVFAESLRFDDGFSKIVHARQPVSMDPLDEDGEAISAPRDEGVHLGWDDEDILESQNRALGAPPDGEDPVLAPTGIFGYRVDVRLQGDATWTSLNDVQAPLAVGVDLGTALEHRWSEVVPTEHDTQLWLPVWFVSWRGGSLVASTRDDQRLMNVPTLVPETAAPVGADAVELRYGERYEFRVRLADCTGGGPAVDGAPSRAGEAPVASLHMKRHIPPRQVEVDTPTLAGDGSTAAIAVYRPRLGFPEATFAAGASARATMLAQIAANDADIANATPPGIHDPDTPYLRVRVLLRSPIFDPAGDAQGWIEWFETSRSFPADPTQPLSLALSWSDAPDYAAVDVSSQLGPDGSVTGPVPLLRGRDVRLELYAAGRNDLAYFANDAARFGRPDVLDLHVVAQADADALATLPDADRLRSVFLRPDPIGDRADPRGVAAQNDPTPALVARLATAVDLVSDGDVLLAREGERAVFGCAGVTHHLAPDSSSLEFAEPGELADQWINVVQAVIERDWTWRGAGSPALRLTRTVTLLDTADGPVKEVVGVVQLPHSVNVQATRKPRRAYTRLYFVDALPPPLGSDGRPYEVQIDYEVSLLLEGGARVEQAAANHLPVTTPPAQVPRVTAAGIALTPYGAHGEYASTEPRVKRLWIEFAEPLRDKRDAYFLRALYRTPDPMLLPGWEPVADPEVIEGVPLDPEWARVITPGQPQDLAGFSSMQRLEPADDSDRRFLVPLPPNTDPASPELFSFFTCSIRVGHDVGDMADPFWTTARGRFGQPLVLEGVQHPPPELACSVARGPGDAVIVQAPVATPYLDLKRALPSPANTDVWMVLYGRVRQADRSSWRNVQLDLRRAAPFDPGSAAERVPQVRAVWARADIELALGRLGLAKETPLSVLAVELLPEPNGSFHDPLGGDLGQVRVLRTSPLVEVVHSCC